MKQRNKTMPNFKKIVLKSLIILLSYIVGISMKAKAVDLIEDIRKELK